MRQGVNHTRTKKAIRLVAGSPRRTSLGRRRHHHTGDCRQEQSKTDDNLFGIDRVLLMSDEAVSDLIPPAMIEAGASELRRRRTAVRVV